MLPVILGISGPRLTRDERALFRVLPPMGVIFFARNIQNSLQLAGLMTQLREVLPAAAKFMVDQEGGRVARMREPHWRELPAAGTLRAEAEALAHGRALGAIAGQAGFNLVAAPVLDLRFGWANGVIGDRGISDDAEIVAVLGGKIAEGILSEGVTPVMKHMPGHGRARVDSHVGLPVVDAPIEVLEVDFLPFKRNTGLPWAMTAHVVYSAVDAARPATMSPVVIREVIREKIGFKGMLISDDLGMGALTGTPVKRVLGALAAGCDVALYCEGDLAENEAILKAVAGD